MKKQYFKIRITVVCICTYVIIFISSGAASRIFIPASATNVSIPASEASAFIADLIAQKDSSSSKIYKPDKESHMSLYERSYAKATDEQKKLLEEIKNDKSLSSAGQWTKRILVIMNELSEDTPLLSLSIVKAVCDEENVKSLYAHDSIAFSQTLLSELNKIAGAPDWEGGSGTHQYYYFFNVEHTEYILISEFGMMLYINRHKDGTVECVDLAKQIFAQQ